MNTKNATPAPTGKYTPSDEQLAQWKHKHGEVFVYESDDLTCYLKRPGRQVVELATAEGANRPFKFTEIIIANCWLGGNDELRTDDKYFMGLSGKISELVEIKTGELKKL